jgi:hypothetical protein
VNRPFCRVMVLKCVLKDHAWSWGNIKSPSAEIESEGAFTVSAGAGHDQRRTLIKQKTSVPSHQLRVTDLYDIHVEVLSDCSILGEAKSDKYTRNSVHNFSAASRPLRSPPTK